MSVETARSVKDRFFSPAKPGMSSTVWFGTWDSVGCGANAASVAGVPIQLGYCTG
jgi:hypothetical protein